MEIIDEGKANRHVAVTSKFVSPLLWQYTVSTLNSFKTSF